VGKKKKKRSSVIPADFIKVLRYRWEFLRRWPKYQRDYSQRSRLPESHWRKRYGIIVPANPKQHFPSGKKKKIKVKDLFIFDLVPDPAVLVVDFDYKPQIYFNKQGINRLCHIIHIILNI